VAPAALRGEVRIMGSKSVLLRTFVAASSAKKGRFCGAQFCTEVATPPEVAVP